ncbi:MAG: hypothetical protein WAO76_07780 [Georgfuchsia sp.]
MDRDTLTLFGAVTGGITGTIMLFWQWIDRRDRIFVGFGTMVPTISNTNDLYVINLSHIPLN